MKSITRYLIPMAGLAAFLPAVLAQDAPPQEKKEMRVLVGPGGPGDQGPPPPHHREHRILLGGPHEMETVTFLGVETRPADATLADQLGLANGTGLIVRNVGPETPAAAVLKRNDVLTKLDDQLLIEARQLAVLIRNHKEGDEVSLTFIRGGKENTAKVKLGKHEVPKLAMTGPGPDAGGFAQAFAGVGGEPMPGFGREEADRILSLIDRGGPPGGPGGPDVNLQVQGGPGLRNITVSTSNSNMVFSDNDGSLDLTIKDGKKTLVAKNAKGEQLFSGPVNTPEERKALPADVRDRLDRLEAMQDFSFKTDDDFKPGEAKDVRPHHQGIGLPVPPPPPAGRPPAVF